ncbi:hypothetical protein XENOCAPTIV_022945 [Xenoophorus captivus]|uniref:Uncharacterized protein n=1 Tax=Xenoophorus captivus TaxID=1517983 RepID=A0ABV0QB65_9TELE
MFLSKTHLICVDRRNQVLVIFLLNQTSSECMEQKMTENKYLGNKTVFNVVGDLIIPFNFSRTMMDPAKLSFCLRSHQCKNFPSQRKRRFSESVMGIKSGVKKTSGCGSPAHSPGDVPDSFYFVLSE